jgi:hypothetical protein
MRNVRLNTTYTQHTGRYTPAALGFNTSVPLREERKTYKTRRDVKYIIKTKIRRDELASLAAS